MRLVALIVTFGRLNEFYNFFVYSQENKKINLSKLIKLDYNVYKSIHFDELSIMLPKMGWIESITEHKSFKNIE